MNKKYIVRLTDDERQALLQLTKTGKAAAYKIKHAHILLQVDANGPNWSDEHVANTFRCHGNTVRNTRQRFVEQGLEAALQRKKQVTPSRQRRLDGAKEAHLIALRCSPPPAGQAKWTLQLLADKLVELDIVEAISYETVRQTLKKTPSSRTYASVGSFHRRTVRTLWPTWKISWNSTSVPMIPDFRS
jgi:transposase